MQAETKKIAIISLGCDKNRVDTENMLSYLSQGNYVVSTEEEAQIIIINTCAFIQSARKEAIDTILQCVKYKEKNCQKLIVTGCLPQKYSKELQTELPEVDAFLGVDEYQKILSVVDSSDFKIREEGVKRVLTTPVHYAYLKIADGCDNHCTYCTIPSIRGAYRSKTIEELKTEAQHLADLGVKELILVAQDTTNYGIDIYKKRRLVDLIRQLSQTDIKWIRLMYCYPQLIDDDLIAELKNNDKLVKYLDIPLQHIDDGILKLMGRKDKSADIKSLIERLRHEIPQIALRTTFITGFPTETDKQFDNLLQFVSDYKLTHVGIFNYSAEVDTPSYKLSPKVPTRVANNRKKQLAVCQQKSITEFNNNLVNKTIKVICDGIDFKKQLFYGRAYFSAPDVDTLVYFKADSVETGEFYDIKITSVKGYDLMGKKA